MTTIGTPLMWTLSVLFILLVLALDLFAFGGRKSEIMTPKQALIWSTIWVVLALLYAWALQAYLEPLLGEVRADEAAITFLTGYVIEKSLSVDNVFVFLVIFSYFKIPPQYQRRVLLYGVIGAIVMRAIMISIGAVVVREFHWILYLFGVFLIFTGIKMVASVDKEDDLSDNWFLRKLRQYLPLTNELHEERFSIIQNGKRVFTPLFLVLILIEITDLIFAVDSIPAIFAITTDPFLVFTSNIFAIMGLRALYFLLADVNERFHLLKYGLALILVFVGIKMLIAEIYKIPTAASLTFIIGVLVASVFVSWFSTKSTAEKK